MNSTPLLFFTRIGVDSGDGGGYACYRSNNKGYFVPIPDYYLARKNSDESIVNNIRDLLINYNLSYDSIIKGFWGPDKLEVPKEIADATNQFIKIIRSDKLRYKAKSVDIEDQYKYFIPHYDPLIVPSKNIGAYGVNSSEQRSLERLLQSSKIPIYIVFLTTLQAKNHRASSKYNVCDEISYFRAYYAVAILEVTHILTIQIIPKYIDRSDISFSEYYNHIKEKAKEQIGKYDEEYTRLLSNHIHLLRHYIRSRLEKNYNSTNKVEIIYFGRATFLNKPVPVFERDAYCESLKFKPVENFEHEINKWKKLNEYFKQICKNRCKKSRYCSESFHRIMKHKEMNVLEGNDSKKFLEILIREKALNEKLFRI